MLSLFRTSLLVQIIGWITILGSVVILLVAYLVNRELQHVTNKTALAHAKDIYEAFVIGAEQINNRENRARLVQSLSQSTEINHIFLLDSSGNVDVSSSRQYWTKTIYDLPIVSLENTENENELDTFKHFNFIEGIHGYEFISHVFLQKSESIGYEKYILIIQLNASNISDLLEEMRNTIIVMFTLGFMTILMVIFCVWRIYLQIPLKKATTTIENSASTGKQELIQHDLSNQLGMMFDAYNTAQQKIIENQKNLEMAIEKEVQASRAKSEFLANMSHELRTPLNSIIGFTKRIIKKLKDDSEFQYHDALRTILVNGEYLLNLINDVLDLSKISAGKMMLQFQTCDLEIILTECINSVSDLAKQKSLKIVKPERYPVKEIEADPLRMKQIFLNLINNAIKYTDKGSVTLTVSADQGPDWISVDVRDTGKGIRQEDQKRLFRRFEQINEEKTTKVGQGTGLGLSLVFEFVRLHRGRIAVESQYGEGSCFRVHLPVKQLVKA